MIPCIPAPRARSLAALAAAIILSLVLVSSAAASSTLLGDQTVYPSDSDPSGTAQVYPFTAAAGSTDTAHVYLTSGNAATTVKVGLYSDSSGPSALLGQGTLSTLTTGAWDTATFSNVTLTAGAKYWLGVLGLGGSIHLADNYPTTGTSCVSQYVLGQTGLPATWPSGGKTNACASTASMYLTGTPGVDTTPPTVPAGLAATPGNAQVALSWTASNDNGGGDQVSGYNVYRNGTMIASPTGTAYTDTGLTNGTQYSYTVASADQAANTSAQSAAVLSTPAAPTGGPTANTSWWGNWNAGEPTKTCTNVTVGGLSVQQGFCGPGTAWVAGHVTAVADPLGSGVPVGKFSIAPTDTPASCSTCTGRADLESPQVMHSGGTYWISVSEYIPLSTLPLVTYTGGCCPLSNQIMEVYGPPYPNPPVGVVFQKINNSSYEYAADFNYGLPYNWVSPPITTNAWHTITLHELIANSGWVDVYYDGVLQTQANGSTRFSGNTAQGMTNLFEDLNLYSNHNATTITEYHGEGMIGKDLASVEPTQGWAGP